MVICFQEEGGQLTWRRRLLRVSITCVVAIPDNSTRLGRAIVAFDVEGHGIVISIVAVDPEERGVCETQGRISRCKITVGMDTGSVLSPVGSFHDVQASLTLLV